MSKKSEKLRRIEAAIPPLIRARRLEKSLTLQALATKADLSAAFISQVERGKAMPSLDSLMRIAIALDSNIDYFLSLPSIDSTIHRRSSPNYIKTDSPVSYSKLSSTLRNQKMDSLMIELPPGEKLPTQEQNGENFIYLLKGEIEIKIDTDSFTLFSGDNAHFNSQSSYVISNTSKENALILQVGQPEFNFDLPVDS